ncbi:MAG: leucyl aminopeptidase family protein [Bacteroidales bacterium]|nr:leucyl aminopeptidase family protein [Bacteroidales bacterium]
MTYELQTISPRQHEGHLVFLYGDEGSERNLPLSKKELAALHDRRERDKNFILSFDRLPHRLHLLSFDSERPAPEVQEELRRSAAKLLALLEQDRVETLAVSGEGTLPEEVMALVEGLTLADYRFDRYLAKEPYHLQHVVVDSSFVNQEQLDASIRLWNRLYWCREWVNLPVQDLNAERFADELKAIAADLEGVSCTVMDKRQIESLRMGGLLAVNRGSVDEPRFVVLEYNGIPGKTAKTAKASKSSQPICLVGKGVMYDTGGLNIKPDDYMCEMKSDMAGAATMASVLFAAADNRLPVHLVALLPLTDNRPGFNAYAADDILTMYDGTTVEVVNTDAEGRLILADAIAYAAKNYNPSLIVDAATLTGAAVRAISTFGIAAMHTHADNQLTLMKLVGEEVYERLVEFPMWKEYDELLKSDFADLRNCGSTPQAGTITAGKFLAHFAGEVPYIHLDIAGVAYFSKAQPPYRAGASAYGVRLLYAFLQMQYKD